MKNSPRTIAALLILIAFAIFASFYLTGCATPRPAGRETAALAHDLDTAETANSAARTDAAAISSNLSREDGKAEVVLEWLRLRKP